jgi:hypothetical protein
VKPHARRIGHQRAEDSVFSSLTILRLHRCTPSLARHLAPVNL